MLAMLAIGFCLGALATTYLGWRRDALFSGRTAEPATVATPMPSATGEPRPPVPPELNIALEPPIPGPVRTEPTIGPRETSGTGAPPAKAAGTDLELLHRKGLRIPIDGIAHPALQPSFDQKRGASLHEAIDILAPRHTAVRAVEDGVVAKLFASDRGGITLYQYDPTGTFCYYYAHLERYADGLKEGQALKRGDVIGYVGTSGNAPKDTPHLHFAIFRLNEAGRWWEGTPIDPYEALRQPGG
jgi:murein DD-endopeptidase MepM/ murein hydrolase activator NlpD